MSKRCDELRIFMLRHGEPEFPDGRSYLYGQTDYPLSDSGVVQAERMGAAMAPIRMDRIVASDLVRAVRTAEIVASHQCSPVGVELDSGLREIDMGEWDGLPKERVAEEFPALFLRRGEDLINVAPPGGETFQELQSRVLAAFSRILEGSAEEKNLLLVAHGGVFWSIVSYLFDIPLGDLFRFPLDFCSVHVIGFSERASNRWGKFRFLRYNWAPDLFVYPDQVIRSV